MREIKAFSSKDINHRVITVRPSRFSCALLGLAAGVIGTYLYQEYKNNASKLKSV